MACAENSCYGRDSIANGIHAVMIHSACSYNHIRLRYNYSKACRHCGIYIYKPSGPYTVKTDVLWWHKECAVVAQLCYILSKIGQNIAQMCYHSTSFLTG